MLRNLEIQKANNHLYIRRYPQLLTRSRTALSAPLTYARSRIHILGSRLQDPLRTNYLRSTTVIVEPPVIQGKSRNVRDVLFCICGMVLDILSIVVGRGPEDLVSLSYLHWD